MLFCTGAGAVLEALDRELKARALDYEVQVTPCRSLGLCEHGANMIVYPEGVWYSGVRPEDVAEIVQSHFQEGAGVARLGRRDSAEVRAEILASREKMLQARRAREASGMLPDDLEERIRAFQESRDILAALELDVFTAAGEGATASEVAAKMEPIAGPLRCC